MEENELNEFINKISDNICAMSAEDKAYFMNKLNERIILDLECKINKAYDFFDENKKQLSEYRNLTGQGIASEA